MSTVLVLLTVKQDMTSHNGFVWPKHGPVKCHDWEPTHECGNGLHGLLPGQNNPETWYSNGLALLVEVDHEAIVDLDGKIKFSRGFVVFCGSIIDAFAEATKRGVPGPWYRGTAMAGNGGTAMAGNGGTATAGNGGTATAGNGGTAMAGNGGTATAGNGGTATAGNGGTATAGNRGTATAGYRGTATAGYRGTATAGDCGTAMAGNGGIIQLRFWDTRTNRFRIVIGYIDEDGIEANCFYVLVDGQLTKKEIKTTS